MLKLLAWVFEDVLSLISLMLFGGVLLMWCAIAEVLLRH